MTSDPKVHASRGGEHLQKVVLLCWNFLEVYIFATTYQKAFIVGPKVIYPTPPHPTPTLPSCPALPYPTQSPSYTYPYPTPSPSQPYPPYNLPLPFLPYTTLYPILPIPTLPVPTLPYPTLPYPTCPSKNSHTCT